MNPRLFGEPFAGILGHCTYYSNALDKKTNPSKASQFNVLFFNRSPGATFDSGICVAHVALADLEKGGIIMLNWSITFLVIGLIAAVFGFTGIAGAATQIAWILFVVFLVLFLVSLFMGRGRTSL